MQTCNASNVNSIVNVIATFLPETGFDEITERSIQRQLDIYSSYGFDNIVVVATNNESNNIPNFINATHIYKRLNIDYDFGSWAHFIKMDLQNSYKRILFSNDSMIGPFGDVEKYLNFVVNSPANFGGITESMQISKHIQSYFWFADFKVIKNPIFNNFMTKNLSSNNREAAIGEKELPMANLVRELDYKIEAMFPYGSICALDSNPTLSTWQRLFKGGFPFIKKAILNDRKYKYEILDFLSYLDSRGSDSLVSKIQNSLLSI